jgi:hypothetical protein
VQEGYEAGTNENGEITQVAIQAYEGAEGFSVLEQVEQATEEIHSTGPGYRYNTMVSPGSCLVEQCERDKLDKFRKFRKHSLVFTAFLCVSVCCVFSSGEGSPQPMEEEEEGTEIVRENGEKYYLTSGLGDGVLQQVEVSLKGTTASIALSMSGYIYPVPSLSFIPNHVVRIVTFWFCSVEQKMAERSSVEHFRKVLLDYFCCSRLIFMIGQKSCELGLGSVRRVSCSMSGSDTHQ